MTEAVLDASAVLALLQREAGWDVVADHLDVSQLSAVNAAEVVTKLIRHGAVPDAAVEQVELLACGIVPVDRRLGLRAGALYDVTSHVGLSLGDRVCLALAERERLPVLTADRAWAALDIGVEIRLIR